MHKTSRRCNENANELNRMLAVNSLVTELWNWHMLLRGTDVETTVQKEEWREPFHNTSLIFFEIRILLKRHAEITACQKEDRKVRNTKISSTAPSSTTCEHIIQLLFHKTSKLTFKALHSKITHWFLVIKRRKYCWSFSAFHWTVQNYLPFKTVCNF